MAAQLCLGRRLILLASGAQLETHAYPNIELNLQK